MPIDLHIQTITGRCKDKTEPSTAWSLDMQEYSAREINQFYQYLKHIVRNVENNIDEDIMEMNNDDSN
jgi:hypothetical protein